MKKRIRAWYERWRQDRLVSRLTRERETFRKRHGRAPRTVVLSRPSMDDIDAWLIRGNALGPAFVGMTFDIYADTRRWARVV